MKKVNLLAAAVLAASMAAPAFADYTPNAYFNGFLRANVGFDKNGGHTGGDDYVVKVGRLATGSKLYGEIGLGADFAKVDDTVWTVNSMIAVNPNAEKSDNSYVALNGDDGDVALRQFNVEVKGLFEADKDATLWVGKKYYRRYDSFLLDYRYYDISGTGFGVENISLGSGKLHLAFTKPNNENNVFDVRYAFPVWDGASLEICNAYVQQKKQKDEDKDGKALPQLNGDTVSVELFQSYNGGWNKSVVQYFTGASANDLSPAGPNHNYDTESYKHINKDGKLVSEKDYSYVEQDGNAYQIMNFGHATVVGNFHISHHLGYSYKDMDDGSTTKAFTAVVRPWYVLTKMTRVALELGAYGSYPKNDHGSKKRERLQKATLAYQICPDATNIFGPRISFYTTWLHSNDSDFATGSSGTKKGSTNIEVGTSVELSW